jgi:hypothetical protein
MTDVIERAAPGTYPVPAGRGRWRLTLHKRVFDWHAGHTWDTTIVATLTSARSRTLTQLWNTGAQLTFTIDGHSPSVAAIAELQQDVYAWRWDDQTGADVCMFRGVIDHAQDQITEQSHTVNVVAHDYLVMLGRRFYDFALPTTSTNIDQDEIAASIVNNGAGIFNGIPGGHLPVGVVIVNPDGSNRATLSGTRRTRSYLGGYGTLTALDDLAKVQGGFDYDLIPEAQAPDNMNQVNPSDGTLLPLGAGYDAIRIFFPAQGVVRSDVVLEYGGNLSTVDRTVDSSTYINYVRLVGNNQSSDPNVAQKISGKNNPDAAGSIVGCWPQAQNAPDITDQGTLDDQAQGTINLQGTLTPSYTLGLRPGTYRWGWPNMGDTVQLIVQSGRLNVNASVRVVGITYQVGNDGDENVSLVVGQPSPALARTFAGYTKDINALARR